jgi:thiamine transport system permease protein
MTRRPLHAGAWLVAVPLAVVAAFFAWPMAQVLAAAASPEGMAYLSSPYVGRVLQVALGQAVWSTLASLAVALPLAWLHHARRIPGRRVQLALHALPFVLPVFVVVFGLQETLGPRGWLRDTGGPDLLGWLGPLGTVVLAHAYYNYGFAARVVEAALRRRPRTLEAAARTLGASPRQAVLRVTWPVLWPAIAAPAALVFLFTFGSYGVVLMMGGNAVRTLETAMAAHVNTLFADPARAAVLGALQLAANAAVLVAYLLLRRRMARLLAEPSPPPRAAGAAATAVSWALAAAALLPVLAVLVQGFRLRGEWSLAPWQALLHALPACPVPASPLAACGDPLPHAFDLAATLRLSVLYAAGSTAIAVLLTACLAYGSRRLPHLLRRPVEALASLPIAGSGVLLAVALLGSFGAGAAVPLHGTPWIVLAAHVVLVFPFVARLVLPAWEARDLRLEESARLLGASGWAVMGRVHWPSLRAPLLAAVALAAALSLGDFGASSLLQVRDTRSLAVWIHHIDGPYNPLFHASAVALTGLLALVAVATYVLVERAGLRAERSPYAQEATK